MNADFARIITLQRKERHLSQKKAAEDLGITWNQIINAQQVPTDLYGIDGIPHIMLVGPDGIILNRDLRGDLIEVNVSRYVKAKK